MGDADFDRFKFFLACVVAVAGAGLLGAWESPLFWWVCGIVVAVLVGRVVLPVLLARGAGPRGRR